MRVPLYVAYRFIYAGLGTIIVGVLLWLLTFIFPNLCLWGCESEMKVVEVQPTSYVPTSTNNVVSEQVVIEVATARPRSIVRFNGNCQGNNRIVGVTVSASSYAPQSQDDGGNPTFYYPDHTLDCRSDTSWRTSYRNETPWLRYSFDVPVVLTNVGLKPGYDKLDPYTGRDRWYQNWRVRSVRFDVYTVDGDQCTSYWQDIPDVPSMQMYNLQDCIDGREAWEITMTILDAYPPQDSDPREFVAISDMMFEGFVYEQ